MKPATQQMLYGYTFHTPFGTFDVTAPHREWIDEFSRRGSDFLECQAATKDTPAYKQLEAENARLRGALYLIAAHETRGPVAAAQLIATAKAALREQS